MIQTSESETSSPIWVDSSALCNEAIDAIRTYAYVGLDTEFYGCDITEQSPVARSVCHVFSVATPSGPILPRGFHDATSYVFAGALLREPCVKEWLADEQKRKAIHNQPVDAHTMRNMGAVLRGGCNTLAMGRFWYPSRAKREGHDLDSMGRDFCGVGKTESFDGLLGFDDYEVREHEVTKRRCACGQLSCMKKKPPHDVKTAELVIAPFKAKVRRHIPLTDLSSGHILWMRYLRYAAWDAVLALWLYEIMMRDKQERPYPWQIKL